MSKTVVFKQLYEVKDGYIIQTGELCNDVKVSMSKDGILVNRTYHVNEEDMKEMKEIDESKYFKDHWMRWISYNLLISKSDGMARSSIQFVHVNGWLECRMDLESKKSKVRIYMPTKFDKWKEKYKLYKTYCVGGVKEYKNPYEDYDWIYFSGLFMESDPMYIDVAVSIDKIEEFKVISSDKHLTI